MEARVIFKDERLVDIVITLNLASLEAAIQATKEKIEGKNRRGRPFALNAKQILEIKKALEEDAHSQRELADFYGVCQATISNINNRNIYQEVTQ